MPADLQRRVFLKKAVSRMLLVVVLAFLFVLVRSLGSGVDSSFDAAQNLTKDQPVFANVAFGQTSLLRVRGQRVWVSRFSELQQAQGKELLSYVVSYDTNCQLINELCVISLATARDGIELRYTASSPAQLPSNIPWFGGFVDPSNGQLYDLWGRAYAFQNIQSLKAVNIDFN